MGKKLQFTELDQYLFGQGTNYDIYRKLGAHPDTQNRKKGVYFARKFILAVGVFFLLLILPAVNAEAKEVSLVKGDAIRYMGYSTHYYYVDGNLAFCLEPDMKSPGTGVYSASELDPRSHLSKAMY